LNALGKHLLLELYGCDAGVLSDPTLIESLMTQAADIAGATIVTSVFHHFSPYGVSGTVVIAESHLAIHTWPEYGYAAIDLFTCGDTVDGTIAENFLVERLHATSSKRYTLKRGIPAGIPTGGHPLSEAPLELVADGEFAR
jgi:S-adenosylmethionine decarboxylase proenzyme